MLEFLSEAAVAACARAQQDLDALAWNRALIRRQSLPAWVLRASAYASAELEGAAVPADPMTEPDSSPMGQLTQRLLLVTAEATDHANRILQTPAQALARLHTLAASGEERGLPRLVDRAEDPLHLGPLPSASEVGPRLRGLGALLSSGDSAIAVAGVLHAELAALRPFTTASLPVARAASRSVLVAKRVDTSGLVSPELGMARLGRPAYVAAIRGYATGTDKGVSAAVQWYAECLSNGAAALTELAN